MKLLESLCPVEYSLRNCNKSWGNECCVPTVTVYTNNAKPCVWLSFKRHIYGTKALVRQWQDSAQLCDQNKKEFGRVAALYLYLMSHLRYSLLPCLAGKSSKKVPKRYYLAIISPTPFAVIVSYIGECILYNRRYRQNPCVLSKLF